MTDDEIEKLVYTNQRLLLIIGYAMGFIMNTPRNSKKDEKKYQWLVNAIDNLVYLDKPLPTMP